MFIFKYSNFYKNVPLNANNKNILFLCHGRHRGVPLTISESTYNTLHPYNNLSNTPQSLLLNNIDIKQYNYYTADI